MQTLKNRFQDIWARNCIDCSQSNASEIYDALKAMYDESWRHYHTMDHIISCLQYFDACKQEAKTPDAIELAIWFHDCIYTVNAKNNEALSRDRFLQQSEGVFSDDTRLLVAELIMDTCHKITPRTEDGKLLADIDLTSFGLPWDKYLEDGKNVQMELYEDQKSVKSDINFPFIEKLLSRDSIYYSPYYLAHFEQAAQDNLQRHLKILQQS